MNPEEAWPTDPLGYVAPNPVPIPLPVPVVQYHRPTRGDIYRFNDKASEPWRGKRVLRVSFHQWYDEVDECVGRTMRSDLELLDPPTPGLPMKCYHRSDDATTVIETDMQVGMQFVMSERESFELLDFVEVGPALDPLPFSPFIRPEQIF
jgi:hypothetical protein